MTINSERIMIYQLMQEIIKERRELSKQSFDLKSKLDSLEKEQDHFLGHSEPALTVFEKEKINQQDYFFKNNKRSHHSSFDRVSKNILSILKQSPIPLSNKQILNKLTKEYELSISLNNLTCNILPRMKNDQSLPIQKAYRGYWQYKRPSQKGVELND
ncbi:hypothetical protein [Enterococcus faecium]|uniref:hypothetical protein n=1 Tax=Enterococcus faecium TaxID=1352 RepID=UPI001105F02F|nr:hypothetical protein [Enterococcus faecium]